MRKILIISLFCFIAFANAQCDLNELLNQLTSESMGTRWEALNAIRECGFGEATPTIENLFEQENTLTMKETCLQTLAHFNSNRVVEFSHRLIDQADTLVSSRSEDALSTKVYATYFLLDRSDYSTANYIFEIFDRDSTESTSLYFLALQKLLNLQPSYLLQAKEVLMEQARTASFFYRRADALDILLNYYGSEMNDLYVERCINDNEFLVKYYAMKGLFKFKYTNLHSFLVEQLPINQVPTIRYYIADSLLKVYGTPSDLKTVIECQLNEPDETARSLMGSAIRKFTPPRPLTSISVSGMVSNLISTMDTVFDYSWLGDLTFSIELKSSLTLAKTNLLTGDSLASRVQVKSFQDLVVTVYKDSLNPDPRFVTVEGWKFLYWNTQYILDRLPKPLANPNLLVNLKSSTGTLLTTGLLQYYEGSWKDAVNNGDGTFTVITNQNNVSLRMTYQYAQQTVNNIPAHNNSYTFQTVAANVQLKNSLGSLMDTGTVQYYSGAWRNFGTTTNGVASKELLPINYSFRMSYEYASIDKQQNLSVDPTVVFQTVNAQVQLKNSLGNFIDQGTVQYYSGAWRNFGTTTNGVAAKELLPLNYSFRMTHAFLSKDKQQNLSANPIVEFTTVLCSVKVGNTNNQPLDNANIKYYAGAWRDLGITNTDGITTKELLPQNISFRASYGSASQDKQQDIGANSLVEILLNVP